MKAHTLIIGTIIVLWTAPLGAVAPQESLQTEEARLIARLNWQRARIEALQAQIRTLSPATEAAAPVPGDEALRPGLSAEELRAARGEPDYVSRPNSQWEIWSYGTTRVTLFGGRITSWQSSATGSESLPERAPSTAVETRSPSVSQSPSWPHNSEDP